MKKILFILFILSSDKATSQVVDSHLFTLSGNTLKALNHLYLYHYSNPFQKEYISEIDIKNGEFLFQKKINEIDTYMLIDPDQEGFLLFIWDGNISLKVDSSHISKSKIINSPLTDEMEMFENTVIDEHIKPIWRLDTLIKSFKNLNNPLSHDSLKIAQDKRNELFSKAPDEVRVFARKYAKDHPNSFVALYELLSYGVILNKHDSDMIKGMSAKLKEHSRFKELIDRSKK